MFELKKCLVMCATARHVAAPILQMHRNSDVAQNLEEMLLTEVNIHADDVISSGNNCFAIAPINQQLSDCRMLTIQFDSEFVTIGIGFALGHVESAKNGYVYFNNIGLNKAAEVQCINYRRTQQEYNFLQMLGDEPGDSLCDLLVDFAQQQNNDQYIGSFFAVKCGHSSLCIEYHNRRVHFGVLQH